MRRLISPIAFLIFILLVLSLLLARSRLMGISPGQPTGTTPSPSPVLPTTGGTPSPAAKTPSPTATVSASLFLVVREPQDESIVTVSPIRVSGTTIPDAIVSVNGDLVPVDDEGQFSTTVGLGEGPNIIEVVASDYEGNQRSVTLAVIYNP